MKSLYAALFSTLMALGLIALPFSANLFGGTDTDTENGMHRDQFEENRGDIEEHGTLDREKDMDRNHSDMEDMDHENGEPKEHMDEDMDKDSREGDSRDMEEDKGSWGY